ncbi:hypothetical protein GOBAR_DD08350 [Gossypium barbadense]|nr:hypothetical protein GOBAR_DD08350 [Gossypium barbadense]
MANFAKPENALKRAEELINVGQKQDALQALHNLITSKRYRAWQKPHEKIMFKYVELCVDMRKGRFAKDGLIQYRIVCQHVNVSSLEEVIKHFMHLSTQKAEQARSQAEALEEALDVDDLEADKRPQDLMLSYVSGEKGKDRSDRELVTPWFKFLWETYRTVLEILRNNSKLEALYAMTAHRAFQFCKQYKRTTEFRRLCEIIRNHLANLNKYKDQRDRPDLSAPESLQLYLDTRFEQLKIATELGLWQEAFRSVEDIHGLMSIVKKTPKASLMVVYYAKLTEIFWISSSHLYHAYAWLNLFSLQKSFNKNLSQKDLQLIASSVVLAALSVTPYNQTRGASHLELENEKERNLRMSNLIGFNLESKLENREVLSRSAVLTELVSKGVLSCATQEVKDLYHLLENDFLPLDVASKIHPLLMKISKLGGKLTSASSVSQLYQTMKIESLSQMIPFYEFSMVEKISVDAVKHNFIAMKVDHMKGAVLFGNMGLESDKLQDHLTVFAESLNKARSMIYPAPKKASKLCEVLPGLGEIVDKEHRRLLARKSIIEKRKEEQERQLLEMEREEESKRQHLLKKTEEAEKKRLAAMFEQQRAERIRKEIEERELEEAQALLQETEKHLKRGKKKPILDGEKLTKQTLIERALSEQLKERQEQEKRLQKVAKTMDHLERAKREEAAPLIEAAFQRRLVEEKVLHEREQQLEVELSRHRHDGDLKEKNRLARMLENKALKQERDIKRKKIFYVRSEEEKIKKMREEEEARKREGEKLSWEGHQRGFLSLLNFLLGPTQPSLFRRERPESSGPAPPSEPDRWGKPAPSEPDRRAAGSRAPPLQSDHWTSGSRAPPQDSDCLAGGGSRATPPDSNRLGGGSGSSKAEPWRSSRVRNPQRG